MGITLSGSRYEHLEQRLNKISDHVKALVDVAIHERLRGVDVHGEGTRTSAALEFLDVLLDELLIDALSSEAGLTDVEGDPYEGFPAAVHDPEIRRLMTIRDRTRTISLPREPLTSVLGAVAGIADALIEREDRFDTPVAHYANLIAALATGQITTAIALDALNNVGNM